MLDMDFAISVYQEAMLTERQQRQDKITQAIQQFDAAMKACLTRLLAPRPIAGLADTLATNAERGFAAVRRGGDGLRAGLGQCADRRHGSRGALVLGRGNQPPSR